MKHPPLTLAKAAIMAALAAAVVACGSGMTLSVSSNSSGSANGAMPATKLNLNTASANDFLTVPNVGNRMLREFMEYRPYTTILQFRREIGKYVDAAQVAEYEQYVFVPVDVNQADTETLRQLPGIESIVCCPLNTVSLG